MNINTHFNKNLQCAINNTLKKYSYDKTIMELFEETVKKFPDNNAVCLENQTISYTKLNKEANQLAWYLRKKGIKQNIIIGVETVRTYEMLLIIFAIIKAGGAYLPIDPTYPVSRKLQIIKDSQIEYLILNGSSDLLNLNTNIQIINLQEINILQENTDNLPKINNPHDIVYVIYTSGSTGNPKGVLIKHHALINRIEWMQEKFPITSQDILIQKTNFSFDVSVWELLWWSIAGAGVTLLPSQKEHDVILLTKFIEKYKITVIHFVPSVLRIFLNYIEDEFDLHKIISLKYVFASGEELDTLLVSKFSHIFKSSAFPILINLYGPTEATIDVSYFICDKTNLLQEIPIGQPINNINLFVLDENLEFLPLNVPGELYIAGVGLALGYLNNPILTQKSFIIHPQLPNLILYKTGDIVKLNNDGFLVFLGRQDDQVKLRGLRIELNEILYHLKQFKNIQDAVVLCDNKESYGQYLIAFIVLKNKNVEFQPTDIHKFLAKKLPFYMIPSQYIVLNTLPLKNNGKVDKSKLLVWGSV
jgi:D-alanine--poly(phosphoribitol) ligase subunit 1